MFEINCKLCCFGNGKDRPFNFEYFDLIVVICDLSKEDAFLFDFWQPL